MIKIMKIIINNIIERFLNFENINNINNANNS